MHRVVRRLTPLVLSLVALVSTSRGAERYVTPSGFDTGNDCAIPATPCRSINHAIGQAASGDTVDLARGVYREGVRLQVEGGSLTLTFLGGWDPGFTLRDPVGTPSIIRSATSDIPPFVGRERTWVVSAGDAATVDVAMDGLVLTRGKATITPPELPANFAYAAGGGLLVFAYEGSAVTFSLSHGAVTRNRAVNAAGGALLYAFGTGTLDATLSEVQITKNKSGAQAGGLYAVAQQVGGSSGTVNMHVRVVNAVISQNASHYFGGGAGFEVGGLPGSDGTIDLVGTTISHNTAVSPSSITPGSYYPGGGGFHTYATSPLTITLLDTIVWGNRVTGLGAKDIYEIQSPYPTSTTFNRDHSDVGDVLLNGAAWNDLGGNVDVDPQFAKLPHLRTTSPLVDAGTCVGMPATDVDGDPRPTGATCDIGADELAP